MGGPTFSYKPPFGKGKTLSLNVGGPLNAMFGGYNLVWQYERIHRLNPVNARLHEQSEYLSEWESLAAFGGTVPNLAGQATLRPELARISVATVSNQGNQNKPDLLALGGLRFIPATFTFGQRKGKNTFYTQRGHRREVSLVRKEFYPSRRE